MKKKFIIFVTVFIFVLSFQTVFAADEEKVKDIYDFIPDKTIHIIEESGINLDIEDINIDFSQGVKIVINIIKEVFKEDLKFFSVAAALCIIYVIFSSLKDNITFEEAKEEVLKALEILGEEYINKLKEAFDNNWIDVYAKPNKMGGAYSMGVYGVHPFVLTNFVNSKRDVSTIAHELGHSMHSYYSNKTQGIMDSNYTIMVAEVASTVNEILLSNYQIKNEKDNNKKAELIYELLEMVRATFFRQAMFAEFEKIVHEKIENGETLSSEDLNSIYYKLNQKYFGEDVFIDEEIKYEWARIPHFYSDFYVYKYSTGVSAAIAIATKILNKEPGFIDRYIEMLKQGCSKKSIDLLKMVDVDLESKETYCNTIEFYKKYIDELKKCYDL